MTSESLNLPELRSLCVKWEQRDHPIELLWEPSTMALTMQLRV